MPCFQKKHFVPPSLSSEPAPPVSMVHLNALIASHQMDRAIDALFDAAYDKVSFRPGEMTSGDILVYNISTFVGEVANGGVTQYILNESGRWAPHLLQSLYTIGADVYAGIWEECLAVFAVGKEPDEWEDAIFDLDEDDPFHAQETRFFELYHANKRELIELLYAYICEHRELFAAS